MDSAAADYEQQLDQINDALTLDPDRQDLLDLKAELENLIELTKELVAQTQKPSLKGKEKERQPATSSSSEPSSVAPSSTAAASATSSSSTSASSAPPAHKYQAGDECTAKYKADGRWYPARITAVSGSSSNPIYTVAFKGYNNTEQASASEIRPTTEQLEELARKRGQLNAEEEARIAAKKRKTEKKVEKQQTKQTEAKEKAQAWQKFATKGAKKGYAIAGATGKSMFKTPDDPMAKVGVVGAGRGMTSNASKQKHKYETLG